VAYSALPDDDCDNDFGVTVGVDFNWSWIGYHGTEAIPSFGGMTIEILTTLIVPVLYCGIKEATVHRQHPV
jgi:hypothetical protein